MTETDSSRRRLLDAAIRRFAADGVLGATLDGIRREAGASVGAVYHHFPDKQALHAAAWLDALADYQTGLVAELRRRPDAGAGVRGGVAHHLRWVADHRAAAALLFSGRPAEGEVRGQNRAFFAEVLGWWRTHARYGAVRDLPFDLIHALWLGPAQEYCRHWVAGRVKRIPTAAGRTLADAAWANLKGPKS